MTMGEKDNDFLVNQLIAPRAFMAKDQENSIQTKLLNVMTCKFLLCKGVWVSLSKLV